MPWFVWCLGAILLVLATFSICNAQEIINLDVKNLRTYNTSLINEHSILEHLTDIETSEKSNGNILLEELPRKEAPGEICLRYDGIPGVVVGKLLDLHRHLWNLSIDSAYYKGNISWFEYQERLSDQAFLVADTQQGKWWERSWNQSLITGQGGANSPQIVTIGKELTVFEFGEITFTNTGQIRLGDFFFYLYNISSPSVDVRLSNNQQATDIAYGLTHSKDVSITDLVQLSIKPRVTIKGTLIPNDVISNASVELRFKFFMQNKKDPWSQLTIIADSQPMKGVVSASVNFELLCW
jgi:hypothetical protein